MKAVILAGGLGTRLSEETHLRPKPMVEIGGKPILWHILKTYGEYGITDFIICCGYKGYVIKEYFANYFLHLNDIKFSLDSNTFSVLRKRSESWNITAIDTGFNTMTGGRLKRVKEYLGSSTFCLTYGDGLSDVNIRSLLEHHYSSKKLATITAVRPPARYGALYFNKSNPSLVSSFREKPRGDGSWINGGFFVLEPEVIDRIDDDATVWEQHPLQSLAHDNQLSAYKHHGYWHPMDTVHDKDQLERLWAIGEAPWKVWK